MLKRLLIKNLFNIFNYNIEFKKEGITILTGPNGYGKTTILKIIDAFASKNLLFFYKLVFDEIKFYTDKKNYLIKRTSEGIEFINDIGVKVQTKKSDIDRAFEKISLNTPFKRNNGKWIDELSDELITFEQVQSRVIKDFPEVLSDLALTYNETINVYMIKEQRLLKKAHKGRKRFFNYQSASLFQFDDTIEEYAKDLQGIINEEISKYSQKSQELDSSFPSRLFKHTSEVSKEEFNKRFDKIKYIQKSITKYGLSKISEDNHYTYKHENAKALSIYLDDTEQKLSVFEELTKRLDLFTNILNQRRFTFKKISINKENGFCFKTIKDDEELRLTELSSGEQQEVVILYELLFNTSQETLVLIDEPEISLHVAWQKEFLNDLMKIKDIRNINIALATHSPQIINSNWDLVVDLEEISNEKIS